MRSLNALNTLQASWKLNLAAGSVARYGIELRWRKTTPTMPGLFLNLNRNLNLPLPLGKHGIEIKIKITTKSRNRERS
jgi:hypothetical protein